MAPRRGATGGSAPHRSGRRRVGGWADRSQRSRRRRPAEHRPRAVTARRLLPRAQVPSAARKPQAAEEIARHRHVGTPAPERACGDHCQRSRQGDRRQDGTARTAGRFCRSWTCTLRRIEAQCASGHGVRSERASKATRRARLSRSLILGNQSRHVRGRIGAELRRRVKFGHRACRSARYVEDVSATYGPRGGA